MKLPAVPSKPFSLLVTGFALISQIVRINKNVDVIIISDADFQHGFYDFFIRKFEETVNKMAK